MVYTINEFLQAYQDKNGEPIARSRVYYLISTGKLKARKKGETWKITGGLSVKPERHYQRRADLP